MTVSGRSNLGTAIRTHDNVAMSRCHEFTRGEAAMRYATTL
jgi:hypothetical protein